MVFKRNTLRNTKKFKQSTSINSSNVKITQSKPVSYKKPTRHINKTSNQNKGWSVNSTIKSILDPVPEADATVYDTNAGYADGKFQDDSKMSVYDENNPTQIHVEKEPWFGGFFEDWLKPYDDPTHPKHEIKSAAGELDKQDIVPPPEVTFNDDELQPRTFTDPEPLPKVDYGDATPGGNASFSVKDYVGNEERTQDIWLHPYVSSEQHQAALDRQAETKLANQIQRDYVASLRGGSFDQSGNLVKGKTMMPTQQGFDSFLDKIDTYNIPISKKAEITKHYNKKKDRLGSFDSSGMWEMGYTKSEKPNKAEQLKSKIDLGDFTGKDWDQYQTLTGNPVLYSGNNSKITKADGTFKPKVLTYKDLF